MGLIAREFPGHDPRLCWRIESDGIRVVRRSLIVRSTGEILDDCWLDSEGRVRSWSFAGELFLPASPGRLRATVES